MTAPRLEINVAAITHNTRTLVDRLAAKGIRVTGVTKAALGSPGVAKAMVDGGVAGLGDSRVENLAVLRAGGLAKSHTLIRSPMLSQVDEVVRVADISLNTEAVVLDALAVSATHRQTTHSVILMVELGDLREGVAADAVVDLARTVDRLAGLRLAGLGTNLACHSGVVPDQHKMDELSRLVEQAETACDHALPVVSGGNSANLEWALTTNDVGRVDELRLGESILLGTEPLYRRPIDGLHTDAFTLVAEVIEAAHKPGRPWGEIAQAAFGHNPPSHSRGSIRHVVVALGRQDVDPDGITTPPGMRKLGMSSDHLVLDVGDSAVSVGDELSFQLDYSALMRAMTSPFAAKIEHNSAHIPMQPAGEPLARVR